NHTTFSQTLSALSHLALANGRAVEHGITPIQIPVQTDYRQLFKFVIVELGDELVEVRVHLHIPRHALFFSLITWKITSGQAIGFRRSSTHARSFAGKSRRIARRIASLPKRFRQLHTFTWFSS